MKLLEMDVAVGVLFDADGTRVLLAKRPPGVHLGDLWEFPGGKVESQECVEAALRREFLEEVGVEVESSSPLICLQNLYPDRRVRLHVRRITRYSGTPYGREGQSVCWALPSEFRNFSFPPANRPIVNAVRLPDRLAILNVSDPEEDLEKRLGALAAMGVRLLRIREGLEPFDLKTLRQWVEISQQMGIELLITGSLERVYSSGARGLHLRSAELWKVSKREISEDLWFSASCHNARELERSLEIGVDFVVLGPVLPTQSHPGSSPLGWEAFRSLVESCNLPVFALGGLSLLDFEKARGFGAQGIAAVRAFRVDAHGEGA